MTKRLSAPNFASLHLGAFALNSRRLGIMDFDKKLRA
jgi:hypothetical protein